MRCTYSFVRACWPGIALVILALLLAVPAAYASPSRSTVSLSDATVGYSKAELRAQIKHSEHVIAFFTTGGGYWQNELLRCRPIMGEPYGSCKTARQLVKAHTWLQTLAQRRLDAVVAREKVEAAARAMQSLASKAEWDSGAARQLGWVLAQKRGWSYAEFSCVDTIWAKYESSWRVHADNPTSDAYGIPQALPGSKMGGAWQTDAVQQITWGYDYVTSKFGGPCQALYSRIHNGTY